MSKKRLSGEEPKQSLKYAENKIPLIIGSYARKLPVIPGSELGQVFEWMILVRSADDTDLSDIIDFVEFRLHASFLEPVRRVQSPGPFKVREEGWGEFPVEITIQFNTKFRPNLVMKTNHFLKLFSSDPVTVSERYDEICFGPGNLNLPTMRRKPLDISDPLLEGRLLNWLDTVSLQDVVVQELRSDLEIVNKSLKVLEDQLRSTEQEYRQLKLAILR